MAAHEWAAGSLVERLEARVLLDNVMVQWSAPGEVGTVGRAGSAPMALKAGASVSASVQARFGALADTGRFPALSQVADAVQRSAPTVLAAGKAADAFLASHVGLFRLANPLSELQPAQVFSDNLGMTHVRYQQVAGGIPVIGADVIVHLGPEGTVRSANGHLVNNHRFEAQVRFSAEAARALAQALFAPLSGQVAAEVGISTEPTLAVLNAGTMTGMDSQVSYLVWRVATRSVEASPGVQYLIDAQTGAVRQSQEMSSRLSRNINDASAVPRSAVSDYYYPSLNYTFGRREGSPERGPNPLVPPERWVDNDLAYDIAGGLHRFVQEAFGINGANRVGGSASGGQGWPAAETAIQTYVEYVWSGNTGACFDWNNGGIIAAARGLATPDVLGHEYGHAISYYRPRGGWQYSGQSGALEESWADCFGLAFQRYYTRQNTWQFGEDFKEWNSSANNPLRSLDHPGLLSNVYGAYPDRFASPSYYGGSWDQSGVHQNSTIPSKAFYLMSEGGPFNGRIVDPIGMDKALQVYYRALTYYFAGGETFNGAYTQFIQAARDLYGNADAAKVQVALDAVEMNLAPVASTGAAQPTIAAATTTGSSRPTLSVVFSADARVAELVANGGIVSLCKVVGPAGLAIATTAGDFAYDAATRTLSWTAPTTLPAGRYELQLSAIDIQNVDGRSTPGGSGGVLLDVPAFSAAQLVQAAGTNLAVNAYAAPEMADWNSDGRPDLLVGELAADGTSGKVRVYLNTGTAAAPLYSSSFYVQANGADLMIPGFASLGACPRVADWDRDGKKDLVIGRADGQVALYANTQSDADPSFGAETLLVAGAPGFEVKIFERARAALEVVDYDDDGDLDLVIGRKWDGGVRWYENRWTGGVPSLIGPIRVMESSLILKAPGDESAVAVGDLNGDGRADLVCGSANGWVYFWANHGTSAQPIYSGSTALVQVPANARPELADVNGDGKLDLLVGAADGLVRVFTQLAGGTATSAPVSVGALGQLFTYGFVVEGASTAPTDIKLSQASIPENQPAGTLVGSFATSSSDAGATFSYVLAAGGGGDDNSLFTVSGNQLLTAGSFDFEARRCYAIRVRSTDTMGQVVEKAFTVNIGNVADTPVFGTLSDAEYAALRLAYPSFGLPAQQSQVNVIAIADDQLSVTNLRAAIAVAAGTTSADLVVLRTTDAQSTIAFANAYDTVEVSIPAGMGATTIVGFGAKPLTLDGNNLCGVLRIGGSDATTMVNLGGLALVRGNAAGSGGGIEQRGGAVVLSNVTISASTAGLNGGGYSVVGGAVSMAGVTLLDNAAPHGEGGALYVGGAAVTLSNVTVNGNSANLGGGIRLQDATTAITNLHLIGNRAWAQAAVSQYGGASTISYLDATQNTSVAEGGGLTLHGGGTADWRDLALTMNSAGAGGGLCLYDGTATITRVTITGCAVSADGGAIAHDTGTATVTGATITGNTAGFRGGAIRSNSGTMSIQDAVISNNTSGGAGGGVNLRHGTLRLTNVVMAGNSATYGGAISRYRGMATLVVTNVTIAGNTTRTGAGGGLYIQQETTSGVLPVTLTNTVIAGNIGTSRVDVYASAGFVTGSNNLIGNGTGQSGLVHGANGNLVGSGSSPIDPQFLSMAGTDWTKWDLRLRATSPAVNAGANAWIPAGVTTDITGGPRISGGTVDMGAYEHDGEAPSLTSATINGNAAQRSMVKQLGVTFSEPVTLAVGAVTVLLRTGAAVPNTTVNVTNPSGDQRTYVLTFSGSGVTGGSLADGVYDLIVTGTGVRDLSGNVMTGDYTKRFHRLFGDSDGNKVVNSLDYARLKNTFGRAPSDPLFNSAFDYEGNTLINALDLARFRQRYGLSFAY